MNRLIVLGVALMLVACEEKAPAPPAAASTAKATAAPTAAAAPPAQAERAISADDKTAAGVAAHSPDHKTLFAAIKAGELLDVVGSPGGAYTVFAPTDAAFDKLPKGTVEGLLKPEKKGDLRAILQHHVCVPVKQVKDLHDGETLSMADGTKVTIHVKDGKVKVDDANVIATVQASNGVVHVVDSVVLPGAK